MRNPFVSGYDQMLDKVKGPLIIVDNHFAGFDIIADAIEENNRYSPPLQYFKMIQIICVPLVKKRQVSSK